MNRACARQREEAGAYDVAIQKDRQDEDEWQTFVYNRFFACFWHFSGVTNRWASISTFRSAPYCSRR